MIEPAKYNCINFTPDFTRKDNLINFDNQRKIQILKSGSYFYMPFLTDSDEYNKLKIIYLSDNSFKLVDYLSIAAIGNEFLIIYKVSIQEENERVYFEAISGESASVNTSVFSEICFIASHNYISDNNIAEIKGYNNNSRHGYNTSSSPAFGFFKYSALKSDFFINSSTDYEYSYGRKLILSSENNIAKRFLFKDLSMYQQNLLKWLCKCENLYIDGVEYQLISDFTEVLNDENTEILDLRADFVTAEQSFFSEGSAQPPTNVFVSAFFMK